MPLPKVLRDLLSLPTATFVETAVLDYIRRACARLKSVSCRTDEYGNIIAHYRYRPRDVTPLIFAAHTDHPGFVALEMVDRHTVRAAFRGGVASSFVENADVRFWTGGRWKDARVVELTRTQPAPRFGAGATRPEEALLHVSSPVERRAPGMWDLPGPELVDEHVRAIACDDLAGVAAMLDLLQRLSRKQLRAEAYCLFTRAEEVGFIGAIGAARGKSVPTDLPIVAIEMSKELPTARIGDGPILRVGDRMSVFTPALTGWCGSVAERLVQQRRGFAFQRKLMDGGSCEATAYVTYGYTATCLCLALGNYHNMNARTGRLDSEYVSVRDWRNLSHWFEALVVDETGFTGAGTSLRGTLEESFKAHAKLLESA